MCPVCFATAAMIAGSIATSGGLTVFVLRKAAAGSTARGAALNSSASITTKKEDRNG